MAKLKEPEVGAVWGDQLAKRSEAEAVSALSKVKAPAEADPTEDESGPEDEDQIDEEIVAKDHAEEDKVQYDEGETVIGERGFARYEMLATLQDIKIAGARNGNTFECVFEVGHQNIARLAEAMVGGTTGHDVEYDQLFVGTGGSIRRLAMTRDADDAPHLKFVLHLPQSEISRSVGQLGLMVKTTAKLVLNPMQGTLGLPDGTEVDLTKRAE